MKTLNRIFISSGLLLLAFVFFVISGLAGFYMVSGRDYKVNYEALKEYVQGREPSIVIGEVYPVTHEEAYTFVLLDKTNEKEYREGYNCVDFALDLWRNATWNHIECTLIGLDQEAGRGHMIVGFPDETGKLLLVDPQTDAIMHPTVGKLGFSSIFQVVLIEVPLEVNNGD